MHRSVRRSLLLSAALTLPMRDGPVHRPISRNSAAMADTTSGDTRGSSTMPFEYEDVRVYVPVRAASQPVRWFILDTGAQPMVMDVAVADALGLTIGDTTSSEGAGRGRLHQGRASGVRLSVGGVPVSPPSITVSALDSLLSPFTGRRAPGIVGSQFFVEHVVELDFPQRVIHVYDPATYRYDGRGVELPLRMEGGVPLTDGTLTLPGGTRVQARLLVDLGAKATLLVAEPFMRAHGLRALLPRAVRGSLGAGIGGETRYDFARVPRLELGAQGRVALDDFVAGFSAESTLRATWYDALLGAEFLQRHRVIFDYSRKRLILESLAVAGPPAEFDMSGLYLVAGGTDLRHFVVHRVLDGSPAAAADVRAGDVVVSANGRTASAYTLSALRNLLLIGDGTDVRVELERSGERTVKVLRLRRMV